MRQTEQVFDVANQIHAGRSSLLAPKPVEQERLDLGLFERKQATNADGNGVQAVGKHGLACR